MEELIERCKSKSIDYINKKTNKPFGKPALEKKLKEFEEKEKREIEENEPIAIEYKNEFLWELTTAIDNSNYKKTEMELNKCIKKCHDLLYSNGAIVGINASNDLIKIIILRLINIIYKDEEKKKLIDEELKTKVDKNDYDKYYNYIIDISNFRNSTNIENDIKMLIHKVIRMIFPGIFNNEDMNFNTKNIPSNYMKLIDNICGLIPIDNYQLFIKFFAETGGNIYEYFTNSYGKGNSSKELGQFFTPFKLINVIVNAVKPCITIDDTTTIYDPCCGSGGLLNRTSLNLEIKRSNIYGCEIGNNIIKYALASLLVNSKTLTINISNCCAITDNKYLFNNQKFNLILTNPPFGTSMNYKELEEKFNENNKNPEIKFREVYPIDINNGACLFLQHIIHMLEDNGIAGVVFPDGKELECKNNYNIRKHLIDNCKILKIIDVQGGVFENTGVKTKILIFKKQKGVDNHKGIEFMEIKKSYNRIKLTAIADLDSNLSFKLKVNDNELTENYKDSNDIQLIQFGDLFTLIEGSIQSSKVQEDENGITLVTGAKEFKKIKIIENTHIEGENLFISHTGNGDKVPIKYFAGSCCYSNLMSLCKLNDDYKDKINIKFIYYYLKDKQEFIEDTYQKGCANKSLNIEEFNKLKLPIPSIEVQNNLIEKIELIDNSIKEFGEIIKTLEELNKVKLDCVLNINKKELEIVKLGEVCNFKNGNGLKKDELIKGEYPVIGGGQKPLGFHNQYNTNENTILCSSSGAYSGFISKYSKKVWASDCFSIIPKNNLINNTYLYYLLKTFQNEIYKLQTGTVQPHIYSKDLYNLKIPVPPMELQEEIVDYCDNNQTTIDNLKKTIEDNKKMVKEILMGI